MMNKSLIYIDHLYKTKKEFLEYYRKLPIQKLAAEYIGKDEDTITNWKKNDPTFSDQLGRAKSEWALKKANKAKPQWLLERVIREEFGSVKKEENETNAEIEAWVVHVRKLLRPNEYKDDRIT